MTMTLTAFLWGYLIVTFLWLGFYVNGRIGEEEDWGRLTMRELFLLEGLSCFWILLTAIAGWAIWASL